MTLITRTTDGLVFRDDFNRADSATVGNGWTEITPANAEILSNQLKFSGACNVHRNTPAMPDDLIIQANVNLNGTQVNVITARWDIGAIDLYNLEIHTGNWNLRKYIAGVIILDDSFSQTLSAAWYGHRMVLEVDGSDLLLRLLATAALAGSTDLNDDFVLKASLTDVSPISNGAPSNSYQIGQSGSGSGIMDEFILCGRNIGVTGLPTGWKVQIDSRTAVVESGGSVDINVDTWALPATTIKVLDGADVEQGTLTPSGGIFGGDIYFAGNLTGEVQIPADVRVIQQNRIFANASIQVSTLVNSEVSIDSSMNASQQNETQITASIEISVNQPAEIFIGATIRVLQGSQVQIVSSLQPAFNGQESIVVSIQVDQRIPGQISAQGSIRVSRSGSITDPSGADNRLTIIEHGAQTELPILWRD
jgi:hypothetical protein